MPLSSNPALSTVPLATIHTRKIIFMALAGISIGIGGERLFGIAVARQDLDLLWHSYRDDSGDLL
jgi:hypothetical protein